MIDLKQGKKKMNDGINNPPPKAIEMGTIASDFRTCTKLVAKARANLNQNAWGLHRRGTETETNLCAAPRMALDEIRIPAAACCATSARSMHRCRSWGINCACR